MDRRLLEAAMLRRSQDIIETHGKDLPTDECYAGGYLKAKFAKAPRANPLRRPIKPVQLSFENLV